MSVFSSEKWTLYQTNLKQQEGMFKKGPRGGGRTFKHFVFVYNHLRVHGGHEPKSIAAYIHKSGACGHQEDGTQKQVVQVWIIYLNYEPHISD